MSERTQGILYLLSAALCWSLGGLLIKLVDLDPLGLAGARSGIAAVLIWAYLRRRSAMTPHIEPGIVGSERFSFTTQIRKQKNVILGAIAYAGTVTFFVVATKQTTAANAILLQYTAPIWVAFLSPFLLREPTSRIDWIAVVVTFCGMGLFFIDDVATTARTGDLLAIIAGIFFALCIMALRKGRDGTAMRMVLYGNIIAALVCAPFLIGNSLPAEDILPLITLGVGQLGLGYIFFAKGIARVTAVEGALIPVLEPILNPLWVALAIGELPSYWSVVGGLVVLTAVTGRGVLREFKSKNSKFKMENH